MTFGNLWKNINSQVLAKCYKNNIIKIVWLTEIAQNCHLIKALSLTRSYIKWTLTILNSHAVGMVSWCFMAWKTILWKTLFLDQRHDFSLLSLNSFLHQFRKTKFQIKNWIPKYLTFDDLERLKRKRWYRKSNFEMTF